MTTSPLNQQNQSQYPSSLSLEQHSQIIQEENPDVKQILLTQVQSSAETMQQINSKFDSSYPCYNCWLFLMILVSGFSAAYIIAGTFASIKNYGFRNDSLFLILSVAFNAAFFAQFLLEKWAISTRDLATANLALKIITVNTISFLALNAWAGYYLYDYSRNITEPSESTAFGKGLLTFFLIVVSILSFTQIFITHFQAIKVRNDLSKRETIRANLQDPIGLLPVSALSSEEFINS